MAYFAHANGEDSSNWQLLREHLLNTKSLAEAISAGVVISDYAGIAGLMHDIGKYSEAFQRKLAGRNIRVDHSTAGAKEIVRLFQSTKEEKIQALLLAYCIAGHHAGLPNYGSAIDTAQDSSLNGRLKKPVEDYDAYKYEIDITTLKLPPLVPLKSTSRTGEFSLAFFTRMIYSALVDADFLETEAFMTQAGKQRGGFSEIQTLHTQFEKFLSDFAKSDGPINQKRTETLQLCLQKAQERTGLFKLTVPTGGGKTISSMAFALAHAVRHNLKRVIYVIPYTSIIEQNAQIFRQALGDEVILEHHSNFDWKQPQFQDDEADTDNLTNQTRDKLRLATENWDVPVVVTTNVQFFESLFSNRSSRCRKLHNIAESVIIFDEAQMLPKGYLKPCLAAIHELVTNYHATAVICTATQPALERILPDMRNAREICPDPHQLYDFYKRVEVSNLGVVKDEDLAARINQQEQALCIVNTRRHAKGLFDLIDTEGRFHLSTLMCPIHRKEVIKEIRQRLKTEKPCRVISTQIMEAGIDMDFPVGYRALAGLDSILQAAGRVNREGKQTRGNLYIFEADTPHIRKPPTFIQQGAEITREILRAYKDPTSLAAIQSYYERLYALLDNHAFDEQRIMACFEKGIGNEPNFDFKAAAERFRLIMDATRPVIIPYDQAAEKLIAEARWSPFPAALARQFQLFSVNIYEQEYENLNAAGAIEIIGEIYSVLRSKEEFYDDETGLILHERETGQAIFVDGP